METIIQILSKELNAPESHIENVIKLLDEGNTLPFIARYRKELHGGMDDTTLRTLQDRLQYLRNILFTYIIHTDCTDFVRESLLEICPSQFMCIDPVRCFR